MCKKERQKETNRCSQRKKSFFFSLKKVLVLHCVGVCVRPCDYCWAYLFWQNKPREESKRRLLRLYLSLCVCTCAILSVWLFVQMPGSTLVNTHMSKVFVTLLTHCFSGLLLPWKHGSHGNKRCQLWGGSSLGSGWGEFDEIGVFLTKSRPSERDRAAMLRDSCTVCRWLRKGDFCLKTCCLFTHSNTVL